MTKAHTLESHLYEYVIYAFYQLKLDNDCLLNTKKIFRPYTIWVWIVRKSVAMKLDDDTIEPMLHFDTESEAMFFMVLFVCLHVASRL